MLKFVPVRTTVTRGMFFPYGTDAPVYYWPFTTVAMIVVNVLVFVWGLSNPDMAQSLSLETGNGLHPAQWLTSNFAHDGISHIVGNMIFLWSFGLVVEGKLGWWKTLAIYLGLGVAQSGVEQVFLLFGPAHHILGASAIICGFMAMSVIWAPENSLNCVFYFGAFYVRWFDVRIKVFVAIFLALQFAEILLTGMALSSGLLHAIGAGLGFAVGIWMVKTNRVDCENWDIFSIRAGRNRMSEEQRNQEVLQSAEYRQWQDQRSSKLTTEALQWIRDQVREGHAKAAVEVYRRTKGEIADWSLPETDLFNLVVALRNAGLYADAVGPMADYLARYTTKAATMRIALGDALVKEHRPAQALKVLDKLDNSGLDAKQRQFVVALCEKARKGREEDPYEVAGEDW